MNHENEIPWKKVGLAQFAFQSKQNLPNGYSALDPQSPEIWTTQKRFHRRLTADSSLAWNLVNNHANAPDVEQLSSAGQIYFVDLGAILIWSPKSGILPRAENYPHANQLHDEHQRDQGLHEIDENDI